MATVKVISLNAAYGRKTAFNQLLVSKKKTRRNLDKISRVLKHLDADLAALQEADGPSFWSGNFDHVGYLRTEGNHTRISPGPRFERAK